MTANMLSAQTLEPDSIKIRVIEFDDSIAFKLNISQIETQLTFLMQGLDILVIQPDTLKMSFPNAAMVRNKVKRHPNEVKAVLASGRGQQGQDSINHVVRPDVQPLVTALNDTTAVVNYKGENVNIRSFLIDVDRDKAEMTFTIKTERGFVNKTDGMVDLILSSVPQIHMGDREEFAGKRLSDENAPQPNGLGEGLRKEDASKRTLLKKISVTIEKANEG